MGNVTAGARQRSASLVIASVLALTPHAGMGQAVALKRGEQVRERIPAPPSGPTRVGMVVTVVAEPGDQLEVSEATVRVNGRPITGFSAELIATAARSPRLPTRMREDQYLVMGESGIP